MLTLPEQIGEFEQRTTTSQGTSVWGDPSAVVLRCGVEPIGPTELPCVSPAGVDWIVIEDEDHLQLISYGREPSVEVLLDTDLITENTIINMQFALADPVRQIEQSRECIAYDEAALEDSSTTGDASGG